MLIALNDRLFLAVNASSQPDTHAVMLAKLAAAWLIYAAVLLVAALWIWGRQQKRAPLIATIIGVGVALGINQLLGLLWYEPRPFMISLGRTLMRHVVENSFPSDHGTFMWALGFGLITTGASRPWGALTCGLGVIIAWERVYLGLHYPLDMATSFVVGLSGGGIARAVLPASQSWLLPVIERIYEFGLRCPGCPPLCSRAA